jgi:predicted RecA/RadA family phage recombinase
MAGNEVYSEAESLVLPVGSTIKSGWPVNVGALYGVALVDAATGSDGNYYTTVKFCGVFRFDMSLGGSSITPLVTLAGQALTVGQAVYITSGGVLTTTATSNTLFGHAIRAKSATTAVAANEAYIRIFGC